jgi:hypothetical protein
MLKKIKKLCRTPKNVEENQGMTNNSKGMLKNTQDMCKTTGMFGDIVSATNMEINGAIVETGGNDLFRDKALYRICASLYCMGDGYPLNN